MKSKLFLISVIFLSILCSATNSNGFQWEKTFGGSNNDSGSSVQQTADDGYIIVGSTYSFGAGNQDVYLIRTDADGNTLWEKTFGGSNVDSGNSVQQTADGGYIIAGTGGGNAYLIKTDTDGNTLWEKTFGRPDPKLIQQTADGGYIIVGSSYLPRTHQVVNLIKTDADGNTLWQKNFKRSDSNSGNSVQQTADGGYIIAGTGGGDAYLIKTDANGNKLWEETFGGSDNDLGSSVHQTANGGYIITGTSSLGAGGYDVYLIYYKLDGAYVEEFVSRFYQLCLDRNPDQAGLDSWVGGLLDGSLTGSDVAYGFVFSQEFIAKNTTPDEYLKVLYEAFFNRQPDAAGKQGWLDAMNGGASREDVLNGFIYATEFANLCDDYGIKAYEGHTTKAQREAVEDFVTRFYQLCLDRNPDAAGLEGWTNNLLDQVQTGADVANGFIYSQEFIDKDTTNEEYLTILYKAFFNRNPDQAGWDGWISELNGGTDRGDVLNGFLGSQEFINLCEDYGITPN